MVSMTEEEMGANEDVYSVVRHKFHLLDSQQ